jgi:hypothetical protein
MKVSTAKLGE